MKRLSLISLIIFFITNLIYSQDIINETGKDGKFIVRDAEQNEALVIEDGNVGITGELSVENMPEGSISNPYVVWDPEDKKFKTVDRIFSKVSPLSEPLETRSWHSIGYDEVDDDGNLINASVQGTAANWNVFTTSNGEIRLGPANSFYAHIFTDRTRFLFNKPLTFLDAKFGSSAGQDFRIETGGTARISIDGTTGNVGIGTTSPVHKLTVYDDDGPYFALQDAGSGSGSLDGLQLITDGTGRGWLRNFESDNLYIGNFGYGDLTLDPIGNLGIGTGNPSVKLHVVGSSSQGAPTYIAGTMLAVQQNDPGNWAHMAITAGTVGQASLNFGDYQNDDAGYVRYANNDNSMRFGTNGSEKMRITSSGAVGIGTSDPKELLNIYGEGNAFVRFQNNSTGSTASDGFFIGTRADGVFNYIWNEENSTILFGTDNIARMRIDGTGRVGIGRIPTNMLDVEGAYSGIMSRFKNTANTASADGIRITLAPNTPSTTNSFVEFVRNGGTYYAGYITGNGGTGVLYSTVSDARLKMNITNLPGALDKVSKIKVKEYEMKSAPGKKEIGFLAQELQEVYPQAVSGNPQGDPEKEPMGVDYGRITPLLVKAIQELKARIEELENR